MYKFDVINLSFALFLHCQTYKKNLKKSEPGPELLTAQDEAVLAAAEPPPFGTTHAVGIMFCVTLNSLASTQVGVLGYSFTDE